jgi:acyl-coenzyme A thioesterase PaaI-like protein
VVAEATIVKRGRTLVLGDVDLRVDGGELVGKSLVTYMVLQPRTDPTPRA